MRILRMEKRICCTRTEGSERYASCQEMSMPHGMSGDPAKTEGCKSSLEKLRP